MNPSSIWLRSFVLGVLTVLPLRLPAQGSLTPPGPPGPTMKTLSQIEPRVPIGSLPYTITNAGSYYLTGNISGLAGQHGIIIAADDVTLDLGGFTLTGAGNSQNGISVSGNRANLTLRNGTLARWSTGIAAGTGSSCSLESLQVHDNRNDGVVAGPYTAARQIRSYANGAAGLKLGNGSSLQHCLAYGNGGDGITVGDGSSVEDCAARDNSFAGIVAGRGGRIERCVASGNLDTGLAAGESSVVGHCTATGNGAHGITVGANGSVQQCAALSNGAHGINVDAGGTVQQSTARANTGSGIVAGASALVAGSVASGNRQHGIQVGSNSQVNQSSATGNTLSGIIGDASCHLHGCTATGNGAHGMALGSDGRISGGAASKNGQAGFSAGDAALITDSKAHANATGFQLGNAGTIRLCAATGNSLDGIVVASECTVTGNDAKLNFNARDAAGIRATGDDNVITDNVIVSNDRGLLLTAGGNLILRNRAADNSVNYALGAGLPQFGAPVVTSTNDVMFAQPWINFGY